MLAHPANENHVSLLTLIDALTEMPEPGEEIYGSAAEWPAEWDDVVMLGAPLTREEFFGDTEFDPLPGGDGLDDLEVEF